MKASVQDDARYGYSVEKDGQAETHEKPALIRVNSCPFVVELAYVWIRVKVGQASRLPRVRLPSAGSMGQARRVPYVSKLRRRGRAAAMPL